MPVVVLEVNVELPHVSVTLTVGVAGIVKGIEEPVPEALVHPFSVTVTE